MFTLNSITFRPARNPLEMVKGVKVGNCAVFACPVDTPLIKMSRPALSVDQSPAMTAEDGSNPVRSTSVR